MDCREYIDHYLAAQADGELDAQERAAADLHLTGCVKCRARLAEERALKALLKERLRKVAAPEALHAAIRANLNRAEAASSLRADLSGMAAEVRRRPRIWAPIAALAAAILLIVMVRDRGARNTPASDFDIAIEKFTGFERHFEPNVPSDSYGAIAMHYHSAKMPSFIWNFEPVGFHLVGGRIDWLPDGRQATYTFYRGPKGAVMCTRVKVPRIVIPPGGRELQTDQYSYSYRGFSVVLSLDIDHNFICILISRLPEPEFSRDVVYLES